MHRTVLGHLVSGRADVGRSTVRTVACLRLPGRRSGASGEAHPYRPPGQPARGPPHALRGGVSACEQASGPHARWEPNIGVTSFSTTTYGGIMRQMVGENRARIGTVRVSNWCEHTLTLLSKRACARSHWQSFG